MIFDLLVKILNPLLLVVPSALALTNCRSKDEGIQYAKENYPFFVYVQKGPYFCAGTIIGESAVLTAAHCTYYASKNRWAKNDEITILHGDFSDPDWRHETAEAIKCSHYKAHPFYNPNLNQGEGAYDVAVVILDEKFDFSGGDKKNLVPCPPPNYTPEKYSSGTLIGLGLSQRLGMGRVLELMEVRLERDKDCGNFNKKSPFWQIDPWSQVCYQMGCKSSTRFCYSNTGGPLVYKKGGVVECLIGVTRFGRENCQRERFPSVFTHAGSLSNWIANQI